MGRLCIKEKTLDISNFMLLGEFVRIDILVR